MPLETGPMTPQQRLAAGPAAYDTETVATRVGASESFKTGYLSENNIAAWNQDLDYVTEQEAQEGYDQYPDIPDDLLHLPISSWDGVTSPMGMTNKVAEIRKEEGQKKIETDGGFLYFLGQLSGFVTSPEQAAGFAALPARGATFASTAAKSAGIIAPLEIGHELSMHESRNFRTLQQSAINVSASVVLGGLISGAFGKKLAANVGKDVHADITQAVNNQGMKEADYGMKSVGAAQASGPMPEGELIENPPWIKWGVLSPGRNLAASKNADSARLFNDGWEHGYTTGKTSVEQGGHRQQIAMETEVNQETTNYIRSANVAINGGYKKYVGARGNLDLAKGLIKNKGQRGEFEEAVHRAMVNGDELPAGGKITDPKKIQAVNDTASTLRSEVYAKTLEVAKKAELMDPEEFATKFADSYAPRRWNKKQVFNDSILFKKALKEKYLDIRPQRLYDEALEAHKAKYGDEPFEKTVDDFQDIPVSHGDEIRMTDSINDTYDRIVHSFDQDVFIAGGGVKTGTGSAFHERVVPLDDNFLLDNKWLESNLEAMTMNHINRVVKPARMKLKFDDVEMEGRLKEIRRSYQIDIDELAEVDPKASGKLENRMKRELESHRLLRDRWYGRKTVPRTKPGAAVNDIFRGFRNLNTSLMMGMVLPTSAGDVSRWNIATLYKPELGELGPKLVDALKTAKLNKKQHTALAIAAETDTRIRQARIFDGTELVDVHGANPITDAWVKGTGALSKGLMSATHLAPYTDVGKNMAAAYMQNDLIHSLRNFARLSGKNKQHMARLGFDENDAKLLQDEIARSKSLPEAERGIYLVSMKDADIPGYATVFNPENMADQKLAKRLGTVLFRESERSIVSPTVMDMPMWLGDSEAGKSVAQFSSFAFAAVNQVGVPMGRRINAARYGKEAVDAKAYLMTGQLVGGGLLAVVLRNAINGRLDEMKDWTAMDYAINATDYSGAVPLTMLAFNGMNMLSQNSLVNAIGATTLSRSSSRPLASMLGPTSGTVQTAIQTIQNMTELDGWTDSEIRTAKRLIPWYKLMYFNAARTVKDSIEGEEN